jgi:hypothetical protein
MKKAIFIFVFGFIGCIKSEARKLEGTIVMDNETIKVVFNIPFAFLKAVPNYEMLQRKVKYFDDKGNKMTLRPGQAKEIRFSYKGKEIRMLSRYDEDGLTYNVPRDRNIFLKLEIDGKLKLFKYYYTENSPNVHDASTGPATNADSYRIERYILQNENGKLKRIKGLTFKRDMTEYFRDCPGLVHKIENKEFRKRDLELMVSFYNSNCGN